MHATLQQSGVLPVSWPGLPKTLRVGIAEAIDELDPRAAAGPTNALVLGQIFEPAAQVLEPLRTEDDTGLELSAAVIPELRFSDGTLLTAEIAARSLRGSRVLAGKVAVDVRANRLRFRLAVPNPRFPQTLAHSACAIVLDKGNQLHGTGPFMFDERPNLRLMHVSPNIRLVRNPYYRAITAVQEVRFAVMPPDADGVPRKLIHALRQEWLDLTTAIDPAIVPPAPHLEPLTQPGNSTAVLLFNTARPPIAGPNVRRGIAAALDRHEIAAVSHGIPAGSILPPSLGGTTADLPRNLEEARRLLPAQPLRLTLLSIPGPRPYLRRPSAAASTIQSQLAAVNVAVTVLETRNDDEYRAALHNRTYDLALAGCIATSPDPADFLAGLSLLAGTTDEFSFTPLVYGQSTVLYARHLHNVAVTADGFLPLADVTL